MATLASQAEIGVWVQASGGRLVMLGMGAGGVALSAVGAGVSPRKIFEIVYVKSCHLVHFWKANGSQCRP